MMSRFDAALRGSGAAGVRCIIACTFAICLLSLMACEDEGKKVKSSSPAAARVNKDDITIQQVSFALQQQRGLAPADAASAGKQVLERLIDQELAVQKAQEQKLDVDARVAQQLEAAKREIIARAYIEAIASGAPKPTPLEISDYYDAHPALFRERRIYNLQELKVEAKPEQVATLKAKFDQAGGMPQFVAYLKDSEVKYEANQTVRAAEQLPLDSLGKFAQLRDGQSIFNATPLGAEILTLAASQSQPIDRARAMPAIEAFLFNERKRKLVELDLRVLRSAAKVEYLGDFAPATAVNASASELVKVAK